MLAVTRCLEMPTCQYPKDPHALLQFEFEIGEEVNKEKFYKQASFWKVALSVLFTAAFLVSGVFMAVWQDDEVSGQHCTQHA